MFTRLRYLFPSVHLALWVTGITGSRVSTWKGFEVLGHALGIADFPVSILMMILVWVLPEKVEILGFGILGILWWYYLGGKADEWATKRGSGIHRQSS